MANTILHKRSSTASAVPAAGSLTVGELAINAADGKLFTKKADGSVVEVSSNSSHAHGNITSAGAIGSTANLPIITTTSGVLTAGSFGSSANTFCQGNDSRLSDSRTPTAHVHSAADITSGTLDNARTTATAADTASTIVLRDSNKSMTISSIVGGTNGLTLSGNVRIEASKVYAAGTQRSHYIQYGDGNIQTITGSATGTQLSYAVRYDGAGGSATTVIFTNGGLMNGATAFWHPSILFPGGVKPTLSSSGIDVVTFVNDGNYNLAFLGGLAFA